MILSLLAAFLPIPPALQDESSSWKPSPRPDLREATSSWQAEQGSSWRVVPDVETGWAEMIHGGRAAASFAPREERDFVEIARQAVVRTRGLHGIAPETLVFDRAMFLPLGQIGSGDKETVRFVQRVNGIRVVGACVNVLLAMDGSLLSVHSTGIPELASFPTGASLTDSRARARGSELFAAQVGRLPTRLGDPELVLDPVATDDGRRVPRLAWQVDAQWIEDGFEPEGKRLWIDAWDGRLLRSEPNIHYFDVSGTVSSLASPGTNPDTSSNPETAQTMKYLRVQSSAGSVLTDANGNFTFPGVTLPLACTFTYDGTFNAVTNTTGANYTLTQTLQPGQANSVLMNPAAPATVVSQANVFNVVNKQRDWVRSINPTDGTLDFVHSSFVNLAQTCNAFFDGGGINFFAAGGGCVNTAYSTVISHEDGHWANQIYLTGNGGDGMGEGNADVWAMYLWDTPIVGAGWSGTGTQIRSGNNGRVFCGDCCGGCYGEVHADGEVWMGAAWKIRNRLNTTNGNAVGDLIANTLFLTWMEAYNQSQIRSIIEAQWLTLDDDDGNINDGTPHINDIDLGFRDQGFPGITLLPVSFANVSEVGDTEIELAPQLVFASIFANAAPPLTSALLRYRVDGGAFQDVPFTLVSGDQYSATIPGQTAPAYVEYCLVATDSAAVTATYPPGAPSTLLDFDVGERHVLRADNFEGPLAHGWTHGTYGDTINLEDDWQRNRPAGKSGVSGGIPWTDPAAAHGGNAAWGQDLGLGTANNGAYSANVHTWLRSPVIDCSTGVGTHLRFARWLTVQGSAGDQANVRVNGTVVWSNPAANVLDTSWGGQDIDISSIADGNPAVQIEFELRSNGTTQLGGWQVDDVEVLWVGVPQCPMPQNFCLRVGNSVDWFGAGMTWSGTSIVPNNDFVLITEHCPPNKTGLYFYGQGETVAPFGNGFRCVAAPIRRLPALTTSATGVATFPLDLNHLPPSGPIAAGQIWGFQLWYRDPAAGGAFFNVSDALRVVFCP